MSAVDWVLAALLAASFLIGLWRGLVFEVLSLLGWVVAFVAAQWWADAVGAWLPMGDSGEAARYGAGFVVTFIAVAFGWGLMASLVRKLIGSVGLRPVDRTLGGVFGLVRGLLVLLALAVVVETTSLHEQDGWRTSQAAPLLRAALSALKPVLPQAFGRFFP
ncbi:CvpA family protein [Xylophilus rhododendri]|uniref:CvpA family protein n=1 Tax=Xylophilus rhododendri TaxID=2697032 RepID=A0A857J4I0_9BURK|nr:CvpA family protein [Xylophilus rhododendri]QHI98019.1 CvpA family protein [Xylophilus rhododendri]